MYDPVNIVALIILVLGMIAFAVRVCIWANNVPPPYWEQDHRR